MKVKFLWIILVFTIIPLLSVAENENSESNDENVNEVVKLEGIFKAAQKGDIVTLTRLVEKVGVNVNSVNEEGYTPLAYAVFYNRVEAVNYLISKKANLNVKNIYKEPLIQNAIFGRNYKTVKILIEKGANVNIPTHFHVPAYRGYSPESIMELMLLILFHKEKYCLKDGKTWVIDNYNKDFIDLIKLMYSKYKNIPTSKRLKIMPKLLTIDFYSIVEDLANLKQKIKSGEMPDEKLIYTIDNISVYNYLVGIDYIGKDIEKDFIQVIENGASNILKLNYEKYKNSLKLLLNIDKIEKTNTGYLLIVDGKYMVDLLGFAVLNNNVALVKKLMTPTDDSSKTDSEMPIKYIKNEQNREEVNEDISIYDFAVKNNYNEIAELLKPDEKRKPAGQ